MNRVIGHGGNLMVSSAPKRIDVFLQCIDSMPVLRKNPMHILHCKNSSLGCHLSIVLISSKIFV